MLTPLLASLLPFNRLLNLSKVPVSTCVIRDNISTYLLACCGDLDKKIQMNNLAHVPGHMEKSSINISVSTIVIIPAAVLVIPEQQLS